MSDECLVFEVAVESKRGMRLDQYLAEKMPELSRTRIQSLIRDQHVRLNEQAAKSRELVRNGDRIAVSLPAPQASPKMLPEEMPLDILYEDDDLLVLNKPAGLTVHPGAGRTTQTLANGLLHHFGSLSVIGGVERPGIVHRLDRETSGCIAVAKNDTVHQALSAQFAARSVTKIYLAIVAGKLRTPFGTIDAPIGRHRAHRKKMAVVQEPDGKPAITEYRVLAEDEKITLLECRPKTGRTHQIRVHLKHLGHPIVGDPIYGHRGAWTRHLLHAWKLAFRHPRTGKLLESTAPIPSEFPLKATTSADSHKSESACDSKRRLIPEKKT